MLSDCLDSSDLKRSDSIILNESVAHFQDKIALFEDDIDNSSLQFPVDSSKFNIGIIEHARNAHFSTEEVNSEVGIRVLDNYMPVHTVSDQNSVINSFTEHIVTAPVTDHVSLASDSNSFPSDIPQNSFVSSECTNKITDSFLVSEHVWGTSHSARCSICKDCSGKDVFVSKSIELHNTIWGSGKPNYVGSRIRVPSPLKIDNWRSLLHNYSDEQICDLLEFGFPIGLVEPHSNFKCNTSSRNHLGALQFPKDIVRFLGKEYNAGAVLGPFKCNPFAHELNFSPLNSVPKRDLNYVAWRKAKISTVQYMSGVLPYTPTGDGGSASQFAQDYSALIRHVRSANNNMLILCSAVLPRPWDDFRRGNIRKLFNEHIRWVAAEQGGLFIATDRVFSHALKIKDDHFAVDGLHLSAKGSWALTSYFADKIHKARAGKIY